ncbi:MAG: hypothetical protein ACI9W2_004472 [Gammaproteobacteria bacterium]
MCFTLPNTVEPLCLTGYARPGMLRTKVRPSDEPTERSSLFAIVSASPCRCRPRLDGRFFLGSWAGVYPRSRCFGFGRLAPLRGYLLRARLQMLICRISVRERIVSSSKWTLCHDTRAFIGCGWTKPRSGCSNQRSCDDSWHAFPVEG